jgi:hypothetical protein
VKSFLRRRPSPALVISLIALFVSLGGVSYGVATGSIDSRELKNNNVRTKDLRNNDVRTRDLRNNEVRGLDIRRSTIQGSDVALNTLTGDDVRESGLGKVPSATSADTAASATSAESLGGVRVVAIKHRSGNVAGATVFNAGGLQLLVSCTGGDEELIARTTVAGGEIAVVSDDAVTDDVNPMATQLNGRAQNLVHNLDDSFNPAEDFDVRDVATAADDRIYQLHYLGGDGVSVTANLITDDDLGANNCIVSGYAVVS